MNGVLGMTELLLDTPLSEDQREYADAVRKSGENLMLIINDILDFAQIEAGAARIQRQEFCPGAIVKGAIELLRGRAEAKRLSLTQELSTELPEIVAGDPARLRQMLVILIGNAIKFTERGEVFVAVEPVDWTEAAVTLLISVHDTGIGISPDHQTRLFDSFYQGDGSNTRKYGGAGLGLAICKQLAEKMGGGIEVESQVGRGSTFRLKVRLEIPVEDPSRGPTYFGWTEKPVNATKPERVLPVTQVGRT
jgi:signal transduction histidine kinase